MILRLRESSQTKAIIASTHTKLKTSTKMRATIHTKTSMIKPAMDLQEAKACIEATFCEINAWDAARDYILDRVTPNQRELYKQIPALHQHGYLLSCIKLIEEREGANA